MNITYLALSEELGGKTAGFTHTKNICETLAKKAKVTLLIRSGKGYVKGVKVVQTGFSKLFLINPLKAKKELSKLKKFIENADVVHERYSVNPSSLVLLKGFDGKRILEVNDPGIETWSGFKKFFYSPIIKKKFSVCDSIITQTETLKGILAKQTRKPIHVVSNGVNNHLFKIPGKKILAERKKLAPNGEKIVSFVGSFREWHGVLEIPEIARQVLKENPDVIFVLAGHGKEFSKVKEKISDFDLKEKVKLLGALDSDKIPLFLKASDVCIAPFSTKNFSKLEEHGFWWSPIKLFEYMAAGKPVVSFKFNEIEKILGRAGIYAPKTNYKIFSEKISKILSDTKLQASIRKISLSAAKTNDWSIKARETIKVYKSKN